MRQPYIGGQAVLEGVMMRSPGSLVVAVRRPDGSIAVREQAWVALAPKLKFLRWPLFRGAVVLGESLHNGFSALQFSAEQAELSGKPASAPASGDAKATQSKAEAPKAGGAATTAMMAVATAAMVGLFIAAPHLLTMLVGKLLGGLDAQSYAFQAVDGVFRIAILLGYLLLVARTPEMKRVFEYHGAEHMAIWTYESHKPLTVAEARTFTTIHPRCGTSFLFVVVGVAVLMHMAVLPVLPHLAVNAVVNTVLLLLVKVSMAFPIAGVAYELQRLSAGEKCPAFIRWLVRPGMWMQNVTTRRPSDAQLEIALVALERALAREQGKAKAPDGVNVYPSFEVAAAA